MITFIVFAFNKDILLYAGVSLIAIGVTRIIILLKNRQLNKIVEGRVKVIIKSAQRFPHSWVRRNPERTKKRQE